MKRIAIVMLMSAFLLPVAGVAQNEFKKGSIITSDGVTHEGSIKPVFKSPGKLVFLSQENKKTSYLPVSLKGFSMEGTNYISYAHDFYQELAGGDKAKLYKKVTDNSGEPIYNGPQVVAFARTTEGKRGDYYILRENSSSLDLITEKNFKEYFLKLSANNDSLAASIKDGKLGYAQIISVVEQIQ